MAGPVRRTGWALKLRMEPYDPDARDADNDGIVQEWTAWERPAGARLLDLDGTEIQRGALSGARPRNARLVDANGRNIDYTPTYDQPGTRPEIGAPDGTTSPLGDHGAPTLAEMGLPTVRMMTAPPQPEVEGEPEVEAPTLNVTVPFNPELVGQRLYANDIDKTGGVTVRGTPMDYEDERLPETLYHVTTAATAVRESGYLRASGAGGLGGDSADRIVSLTTDRTVAEGIQRDLKLHQALSAEFGEGRVDPTEMFQRLQDEAGLQGWSFGRFWAGGEEVPDLGYNVNEWLSQFFAQRSTATNNRMRNPIIFSGADWANMDPEDIQIIAVSKSDIVSTGAMITDFDLDRSPHGLSEVRVYGDVPIDNDLYQGHSVVDEPEWAEIEDIIDWEVFGVDREDDNPFGDSGLYEIQEGVISDWGQWEPCREIRREAYALANLEESDADPNLHRRGGYFGNGWSVARGDGTFRTEQARFLMGMLALDAKHGGDQRALYRAMDVSDEDEFINFVQSTETIDIPLLSFADKRDVGGADYLQRYGSGVLIEVEPGAAGMDAEMIGIYYDDQDDAETVDRVRSLVHELMGGEYDDEDEETGWEESGPELLDLLGDYEAAVGPGKADLRAEIMGQIGDYFEGSDEPLRWGGEAIDESNDSERYYEAAEAYDEHPNAPREVVSGGRFEVLGVGEDPRGAYGHIVRLRQLGVYDPQVPGRIVRNRNAGT